MPRLSIIIPSFQQRDYLAECLASAVASSTAKVELIVVDGGSTDGSVGVIKEFEPHLAWWVSEPDKGQTDAINKGLRRATGDVWAYLNSDDLLQPGGLDIVAKFFTDNPDADWLSGGCRVFGEDIEDWYLNPVGITNDREILTPWDRPHPYVFPQSGACFMRRHVIDKIGYFDPSYHYSMDMEYYTRAAIKGKIAQHITGECLAAWRLHTEAKSFQRGVAYAFREDEIRIAETYLDCLDPHDQQLLKHQLTDQKRELFLRKAMWNHRAGDGKTARSFLWQALQFSPSCLLHRPWLGAARRILLGSR
ncbi:MAG: glycosyltransferase family 2 protein [Planctomycetales bacterium]|nr:glycosyltransferase family 2 protein [Planctomycetales bacterium]